MSRGGKFTEEKIHVASTSSIMQELLRTELLVLLKSILLVASDYYDILTL